MPAPSAHSSNALAKTSLAKASLANASLARTTAVAALATTLLATFACTREGPPPVAPVELAIAPIADAGIEPKGVAMPPSALPSADPSHLCFARLDPEPIQTQNGCQLDERISAGPGRLAFNCSGDGPLEAVFGDHRFEGTVTRGNAVLTLTTEIDWQDGCHWETKQGLRGTLKVENGSIKQSKLVWSYSEKPVRGTSCYGSCTARAEIAVEQR